MEAVIYRNLLTLCVSKSETCKISGIRQLTQKCLLIFTLENYTALTTSFGVRVGDNDFESPTNYIQRKFGPCTENVGRAQQLQKEQEKQDTDKCIFNYPCQIINSSRFGKFPLSLPLSFCSFRSFVECIHTF